MGALFFAGSQSARADVQLSSLAGGVDIATPLGSNYLTYQQATGGSIQARLRETSFLGERARLHAAFEYLPYALTSPSTFTLRQYNTFVGIAFDGTGGGWIRPFITFDIGASYNSLSINTPNITTTSDAGLDFAVQTRPGFLIPVNSQFGLQAEAPLTLVLGTNKFTSLNGVFSLRWTF